MQEALRALIDLAHVRGRLAEHLQEKCTDLHSEVLQVEKAKEEQEAEFERRIGNLERASETQSEREGRILTAYKNLIDRLPRCDQSKARDSMNNALAEEIPF
jgi:uncharacterized membrane protein YccC